MEKSVICIEDVLIGDSITAFPALIQLSMHKAFDLWIENPQVRSLWTRHEVKILEDRPHEYNGLSILSSFQKYAFSGLHVIQSWFDNFDLPIPEKWNPPEFNVKISEKIDDVFDVIICPFNRRDECGLRTISFYKWDRIISALINAGLKVAVAGSFSNGQDEEFWTDKSVVKLDTMPLPTLGSRLLSARCTVTIDAGPGHLAHMLNVPHVHLIPEGPKLPPKEWVSNRNVNAFVLFEKFPNVAVEKIMQGIFSVLSQFNRSEYLEENKDLEGQVLFYASRLAAWQHFCLFKRDYGRKFNSYERRIVPGWYDDIFRDNSVVDTKEIFENFLSLGDNCEFGLVQRHFGADPLDILRWMTVPFASLCRLFEDRFEGFAEDESLVIEDHAGEYVIHEKKYGLFGHSFVQVGDVEHNTLLNEVRKRFLFLKRKILDDLEEGRRILVYKNNQPLSKEQKSELFRCVRHITTCPLLIVEVANEALLVGTCEQHSDGLFYGFVERFAPYERAFDICPPSWLGVAWMVLDSVRGSAVGGFGAKDWRSGEIQREGGYEARDRHDMSSEVTFASSASTFIPLELKLALGASENCRAPVTILSNRYRCVVNFDNVRGFSEVSLEISGNHTDVENFGSLFSVKAGINSDELLQIRIVKSFLDGDDASRRMLVFGSTIPVPGRVLEVSWSKVQIRDIRAICVLFDDEPLAAINATLAF